MASEINVLPSELDLFLYAGDGVSITLTVTNTAGSPVDVSGAVSAQIRADRIHPDDPPLVSFTVSLVDAYLGVVVLSLTGEDTQSLIASGKDKFKGVWDVQWVPSGEQPRTICQGNVECVADVTR